VSGLCDGAQLCEPGRRYCGTRRPSSRPAAALGQRGCHDLDAQDRRAYRKRFHPRCEDQSTPIMLRSICVFCGSKVGVRPEYADAAASLGRLLAGRGIRLVYGGGNVGLMGVISEACMAAGGEVVGVMPQSMVSKEIANRNITKLHIVNTMHE